MPTPKDVFSSSFAQNIYLQKYSMNQQETWRDTCKRVIDSVTGQLLPSELREEIFQAMLARKFIPGGRYLYSAGREFHQVNNCLLLRPEDSREGWAEIMSHATSALMTGAGIGAEYSLLRERGAIIRKTGGTSTGPIALMHMVNEAGRHIMQGGQRRCLPAGTLITMADWSKKKIEEINIGDLVLTRHGPRAVVGFAEQGIQDIIEIETEHGIVKSSSEHRWLSTDTAKKKGWKRAKNLSLLNKLYFYPSAHVFDDSINLDVNFAYMLGYFLGDGCAYSCGRTHEVTFQFAKPKHNHSHINRIIKVMEVFGINKTIRQGHGDCTELRYRSKKLVKKFQKWKVPHQPFGIPPEVMGAPLEARYAFVAGWFDADGCFKNSGWSISNKHPSTRKNLMTFLRMLGFLVSESGSEIRFCSYQNQKFVKTIGKYTFKKWKVRPSKQTSEIPSKIISIKYLSPELTYDIQVEDVEEFIADDFISHNSAIWAGLRWNHPDVFDFMNIKNWSEAMREMKRQDPDFPLPMEGTNISVGYDTEFFIAIEDRKHPKYKLAWDVWDKNCLQAFSTAEPGMSFNFCKDSESLRNACTEVTSSDDSDRCNLGTVWIQRCKDRDDFARICHIATIFLLCGGIYSHLPYEKVKIVGEKNNRIGVGIGGFHEWMMAHNQDYEVTPELHKWLNAYEQETDSAAYIWSKTLGVQIPKGKRSIAPNGTIGIIAESTTGIEPLICKSYKRRYLKGETWVYEYVVDASVKRLLDAGVKLENIKDSYDIPFKNRVKFQADVQNYVDQAISSTCNLPAWGSELNNEKTLEKYKNLLLKYAKRLRGFTCYPDGCRTGQPFTRIPLDEAMANIGTVFEEKQHECTNGVCGL